MERNELKGKQTPGKMRVFEANARRSDGHPVFHTIGDAEWKPVCSTWAAPNAANAALYAEAHNVANETGMWPLDMVERINGLEAELEEIRQHGLDQPV